MAPQHVELIALVAQRPGARPANCDWHRHAGAVTRRGSVKNSNTVCLNGSLSRRVSRELGTAARSRTTRIALRPRSSAGAARAHRDGVVFGCFWAPASWWLVVAQSLAGKQHWVESGGTTRSGPGVDRNTASRRRVVIWVSPSANAVRLLRQKPVAWSSTPAAPPWSVSTSGARRVAFAARLAARRADERTPHAALAEMLKRSHAGSRT